MDGKVYVVIGNWCEDTWVEGVFSTEEKAQEHVRHATNRLGELVGEYFEVDEWTLDVGKPQ